MSTYSDHDVTRRPSNIRHQVCNLAAAIVGWILATISTDMAEWRDWSLSTPVSPSNLVYVGMWQVCFHHNISRVWFCHHYTLHEHYLPLDIRMAQHLLVVASLLGLLGKASTIFIIRNLLKGNLQRNAT
ncbi:claudin-34-like [Choloepus didactylus]|uniref:claudin-34-like n=1 Tax=Choloepus didactylus TaxID=27675 RepID=UPI00189FC9A4|nr:claudin-34-like [Choloepus didactylus]